MNEPRKVSKPELAVEFRDIRETKARVKHAYTPRSGELLRRVIHNWRTGPTRVICSLYRDSTTSSSARISHITRCNFHQGIPSKYLAVVKIRPGQNGPVRLCSLMSRGK